MALKLTKEEIALEKQKLRDRHEAFANLYKTIDSYDKASKDITLKNIIRVFQETTNNNKITCNLRLKTNKNSLVLEYNSDGQKFIIPLATEDKKVNIQELLKRLSEIILKPTKKLYIEHEVAEKNYDNFEKIEELTEKSVNIYNKTLPEFIRKKSTFST